MFTSVRSSAPSRLRVLIIDDDDAIRHALRRFFQRQGWDVDDAPDGQAALAILLDDADDAWLESPYDVIICDLRMPGIAGAELYACIAERRPALLRHFVFSTGDTAAGGAAAFVARAGRPVLEKPFQLATLRTIVDALLAAR